MKKLLALILSLLSLTLVLPQTACSIIDMIEAPPELKEGERYFEGEADFEYAESCTVSFVLSADGKSIHSAKVTMINVSFEKPYEGRTISYSAGRATFSNVGTKELDEYGYVEIESRQIVLRFTIDEGSAYGEVEYTHKSKVNEKAANRFSVLVGTFPFVAEDKTDVTP